MSRIKIVVTGPAHSGKTTLIEELKRRGYPIIPESAIDIISFGVNLMNGPENWQKWRRSKENEKKFQMAVLLLQKAKESLISEEVIKPIFLDRGTLDGIAYLKLRGLSTDDLSADLDPDYSLIFVLEPLHFNAREGSGRIDTEEENRQIEILIKEVYREYNFQTIDVHVFHPDLDANVKERVDFIIEHVNEIIRDE